VIYSSSESQPGISLLECRSLIIGAELNTSLIDLPKVREGSADVLLPFQELYAKTSADMERNLIFD